MANFAQATIVGHLGGDPELRHTPDGQSVASVSVATSRKRQNGEVTTWWRCTVWGKRGEALAQHATKGQPMLFTGEPFQREWQDSNGNNRISLELDVKDWAFVSSKGDAGAHQASQQSQQSRQPSESRQKMPETAGGPPFDDDIPF